MATGSSIPLISPSHCLINKTISCCTKYIKTQSIIIPYTLSSLSLVLYMVSEEV
ncbi:hypothetical protein LguiB_006217 [Lonicera macranthoides]